MYASKLIVSNNPQVQAAYAQRFLVDFVSGSYLEVLERVRDRIHQGDILLTHPLSGSVKPNETPYKSVVLAPGEKLQWESLQLIEDAIVVVRNLQKDEIARMHDPALLTDFQTIDLTLLRSALSDKE